MFKQATFALRDYARLCVLLICVSISPFATSEDLLDIYHLALKNDPQFEVARYRLQAELEKYPQAVSGFLPEVSLAGGSDVTRAESQFSGREIEDRKVDAWNWAFQLTQPVIRLENKYAFDEAKASVEQAKAQYELAEQDMILRITEAYFGVLSAKDEIEVVEAALAAANEQLNIVTKGLAKGVSARTDVLEAQSRVDLAKAELVGAKNELDIKSADLRKIVDVVPDNLNALSATAKIPPPEPNNLQAWVQQAEKNHPAVRVAKHALTVGDASLSKARAARAPTLDIVTSYGTNYASGTISQPDDYASKSLSWQVGVRYELPIFTGGLTSSRISEAKANQYRAGAELEVAVRQASTDARTAFAGVMNGLAQMQALNSATASGQSIVDASKRGYQLGVYNNFKVLDAVQNLYGAKRDHVKARYETLLQALKLKASSGILTQKDLVNANSLLEKRQKRLN